MNRMLDESVKHALGCLPTGRKLRVLEKGRRILATNPAIYRLYREIQGAG